MEGEVTSVRHGFGGWRSRICGSRICGLRGCFGLGLERFLGFGSCSFLAPVVRGFWVGR